MHALVIGENKAEREAIASALQATHRVEMVADKSAAMQILERESPDLVIVSWSQGAPEIVRRIRSYDETRHTYILALIDKIMPAALPAMYQIGIDDFVRRPLSREELLLRAEAPMRIRRWKGALLPNEVDPDGSVDLRKLNCFRDMGQVVSEDISQILGPLEIADGWLMAGELRGACIPMSITSEQAEIRVSIVIESKLVKSLAVTLLGDGDMPAEAIEDMLREIANTAGGAVKRAAALEKMVVTTGLPVNEARGVTRNEMTKCWTARITGTEMQLGIIGEIHKRTNVRVPIAKLVEGMVLSHDLRNEAGALVMPAGTRLTATAVARISTLLGPRFVVDVSSAA